MSAKHLIPITGLFLLVGCKTMDSISSSLNSATKYPTPIFNNKENGVSRTTEKPIMSIPKINVNNGNIVINGKPLIDVGGEIVGISKSPHTANISYISKNREKFSVKTVSSDLASKPKTLASYEKLKSGYIFTLSNGEQRFTERFILGSKGILLVHQGNRFSYIETGYISKIHSPDSGLIPLEDQADDISSAGHIGYYHTLGNIKVGPITQSNSYALEYAYYDIKTGERKTSGVIKYIKNDQEKFIGRSINASLKTIDSPDGFLVFSISPTYESLYASNLHTGVKKAIVHRISGISSFEVALDNEWKVKLESSYGAMEKRIINDVAGTLAKLSDSAYASEYAQ